VAVVALGLLDQIASAVQQETAAAEVPPRFPAGHLFTQSAAVDLVSVPGTPTAAAAQTATALVRMDITLQQLVERQIEATAVVAVAQTLVATEVPASLSFLTQVRNVAAAAR
jgi:hypothetical protein